MTSEVERLPWGWTIDEWSLPLEQPAVDNLVDDHPYLRGVEDLHVDELNEDYIDTLARNGEWHIFRSHLLGAGIYVWNHAIGGGFVISEDETYWSLAECFHSLYSERESDGE